MPVSLLEREHIRCGLSDSVGLRTSEDTLAASDERIPVLLQVAGISLITARTVLGAVGDI